MWYKKQFLSVHIEWIDGAAIFLAVIIVVLTTAGNDYLKERQFSALCGKVSGILLRHVSRTSNTDGLLELEVLHSHTGRETAKASC